MNNDRVLILMEMFQTKLAKEGVTIHNVAMLDALFYSALTIHRQEQARAVVVHVQPYRSP